MSIIPRSRINIPEQKIINTKMSELRVCIEHAFDHFLNLFTLFEMDHFQLKIMTGHTRLKKLFYMSFLY